MTVTPQCYVRSCKEPYVGSIGSEWKYPDKPLPACEQHYRIGKKPFDGACAECGKHTMKLPLCVTCRQERL
jgi:hypothetical protein